LRPCAVPRTAHEIAHRLARQAARHHRIAAKNPFSLPPPLFGTTVSLPKKASASRFQPSRGIAPCISHLPPPTTPCHSPHKQPLQRLRVASSPCLQLRHAASQPRSTTSRLCCRLQHSCPQAVRMTALPANGCSSTHHHPSLCWSEGRGSMVSERHGTSRHWQHLLQKKTLINC